MDLPHSHRISRVLCYSGYCTPTLNFAYGAITLFCPAFQLCSTIVNRYMLRSLTPTDVSISWFGLFPFRSPLLRKSLVYFLFLRVLRCFSSPGSPPYTIYSCMDTLLLRKVSFLIRTSTDQKSFALPRSFSQLITSFIGA